MIVTSHAPPGEDEETARAITGGYERANAIPPGDDSRNRKSKLYVLLLGGGSFLGLLALSKLTLETDVFPAAWYVPVGDWIASGVDWFNANGVGFYQPLGDHVELTFEDLLFYFNAVPPAVLSALFVGVILLIAGWRLAGLALLTILWIAATGLWEPALETLALMGIAVAGAAAVGIAWGIAVSMCRPLRATTLVALDGMQAIPAFVYLIPVVLIFGSGNAAALLVTIVYAIPPAVRLTVLGIEGVAVKTREAAVAYGATRVQVLTSVQLPLARKAILAGVNQTIMFAMAMSIIAAMIGAGGLGQPVWRALTRLELGDALEGGIALVLMAIVMDRTSGRFGRARTQEADSFDDIDLVGGTTPSREHNWRRIALSPRVGATTVSVIATMLIPSLRLWDPTASSFEVELRGAVDDFVTWVNTTWGWLLDAVNQTIVRYLLEPMMEFLGWLPWLAVVVLVGLLGYFAAGLRLALMCAAGISAIGLVGMWDPAVITVSVVGTSVAISALIGVPLGTAMAVNRQVEAPVRPVLDVLQTMPIFLFVIPAVIVIGSGPVSGIFATVLYAMPPVARLTCLALTTTDKAVVEAARSFGATSRQILTGVRFPLGIPSVLAGLNQAIMLSLAMAVVSAFIGTPGLGATILVALTEADIAKGFEAGLSMLVLAVVFDRITHGLVGRVRSTEHLTTH